LGGAPDRLTATAKTKATASALKSLMKVLRSLMKVLRP